MTLGQLALASDLDQIVADLLIALFVIDFVQLGLLVLDVFNHSAHDQAQVLAVLEQVDDLLVEHHFPLIGCVVASQVRQVHIAGAVSINNQSTSWDGRVSCVIDQQDDVAIADVITLRDNHDHIIAHMGAMLV
ncbi:unnamed protein product [Sphagnum jensenii]|uniref:Uncharacterized protein n=1 Tax=Sphagnum jensenii TaxID=128206 RepID=A0ABP1A5H4_9BRYO